MKKLPLYKQAYEYANSMTWTKCSFHTMGSKLWVSIAHEKEDGYVWRHKQVAMKDVKFMALKYRDMVKSMGA